MYFPFLNSFIYTYLFVVVSTGWSTESTWQLNMLIKRIKIPHTVREGGNFTLMTIINISKNPPNPSVILVSCYILLLTGKPVALLIYFIRRQVLQVKYESESLKPHSWSCSRFTKIITVLYCSYLPHFHHTTTLPNNLPSDRTSGTPTPCCLVDTPVESSTT